MKTSIFTVVAFFLALSALSAQNIADNTIGLRLGDNDGFGAEVTYQRALKENTRIEANLGWRTGSRYDGFKLTGLYQWVWELDGNFNWYAGGGGGLASYDFDDLVIEDETFVFIAGNIGIEYDFNIPLLLSLDFRPEIGFGDFNDDLDFDIALSVRYQF